MNRYLTICLLATLAGCATSNIDDDFSLDKATASGVAAGTITYTGDYAAYILHIVSVTTGKTYRVEHGSSQTLNPVLAFKGEPAHPLLGKTGSPFAVELPAGSYEIRTWQVSQGPSNIGPAETLGLKFDVESGKAIYLGNYHFRISGRMMRLATAARVNLVDEAQRDVPVLQEVFPALKTAPLTMALAPQTRIENIGGLGTGKVTLPIFVPVVR